MKKKLLSLVLAGAMVASTSVSAFATTTTTTHEVGENREAEHQVTVTGNIANKTDQIVPETISVTIPTAVSFTIDKSGNVDSANINITSNSEKKVDVIAYQFIDPSANSNITVVPENDLGTSTNTATNRFVSLKITGGTKDVSLKSGGSTSGILNDNGSEYALTDKPVIGTVNQNTPLTLKISGSAAIDGSEHIYKAPDTAIKDEFKLILKIQKTR